MSLSQAPCVQNNYFQVLSEVKYPLIFLLFHKKACQTNKNKRRPSLLKSALQLLLFPFQLSHAFMTEDKVSNFCFPIFLPWKTLIAQNDRPVILESDRISGINRFSALTAFYISFVQLLQKILIKLHFLFVLLSLYSGTDRPFIGMPPRKGLENQ